MEGMEDLCAEETVNKISLQPQESPAAAEAKKHFRNDASRN